MRFAKARPRERPENVVALINIVFLLLIFLLLAGTIAPQSSLRVTPPEAGAGDPAQEDRADLVIAADGRIAYFGEIVDRAALDGLVRAAAAGTPEFALTVLADREAEAADVLDIMAGLRKAGVARIELMADTRR